MRPGAGIGRRNFPMIPFLRTKTRLTTATVCCPSRITVRPLAESPTEAGEIRGQAGGFMPLAKSYTAGMGVFFCQGSLPKLALCALARDGVGRFLNVGAQVEVPAGLARREAHPRSARRNA